MRITYGMSKSYSYKNKQDQSMESILFLAANIESYLEKILEPFNITLRQYRIMRKLRMLYPNVIAVSELKEYLIHKSADVSRLAERMARAGWIEKTTCIEDKRVTYVKITQQGLDLMHQIDQLDMNLSQPVNVLTDENSERLNEYLDLMLGSFSN